MSRLLCEIALATGTAPSAWRDATAEELQTIIELLKEREK